MRKIFNKYFNDKLEAVESGKERGKKTYLTREPWTFTPDRGDVGRALSELLATRQPARLLGIGEPLHGRDVFCRVRNEAFRYLVEQQGFRSIALETCAVAALAVDDYVTGRRDDLDTVLTSGFSHGFGAAPSSRQLVEWMREYNADRPDADRLRFYGMDAPTEFSHAPSPRESLHALYDYLAERLDSTLLPCSAAELDRLVGAEQRWTDPAAMFDPARSFGDSDEVRSLRIVVEDLESLLRACAPELAGDEESWWRARVHARTAAGLLRYHAVLADRSPSRLSRGMSERDTLMAAHLRAMTEREAERGPTLLFAHNFHLQKVRSGWWLGENRIDWWGAGALVAAYRPSDYVFVAGALGSAPEIALPEPAPDTPEGALAARAEDDFVLDTAGLTDTLRRDTGKPLCGRADVMPEMGYFGLDPEGLDSASDAVFFLHRA